MQLFRHTTYLPAGNAADRKRPASSTTSPGAAGAEGVARMVLETIPVVMQVIRETMRAERRGAGVPELSVPQFRALALLFHHADVSLSEVAEMIGIGLPSASKLVDGLVARGLITRTEADDDRRRKRVRVTAAGRAAFERIQARARVALAAHLKALPPADAAMIGRAMAALQRHLGPVRPGTGKGAGARALKSLKESHKAGGGAAGHSAEKSS